MISEEQNTKTANGTAAGNSTDRQQLAIAAVPKQPWIAPTSLPLALERGTLFENLYFPFYAGGKP
ncbi:MAG: spore coat associated protein CotJA [Clostridium sp.]|nr:spore coat associated protein CotJA [Clostridiaceae bacterium]MDD6074399.1 spore coat associated protein CotJA [Clostridium sp.]MDY5482935.1 spore coat associated protein CotJA [Clostridium sp.]